MTDEKEKKESILKDMEKYYLAAYAMERINARNTEEGKLAGMAHLVKTSDLEDLLDTIGLEGSPMEAIKVHATHYYNKLGELKVSDALEYFKAPKEVKDSLASCLTKTVKELDEGAEKYNTACKKLNVAKTETEVTAAFKEKMSYEQINEAYEGITLLNSILLKEKSAKDIAEYSRKKLAKVYAKEAKEEKEQKKAA